MRKLTEVTTSVNWQNSGRGLALLLKTKEGKSMEGKRLGQTRAKRFKRHQRLTILKSTEVTIIDSECFKNFTNLREIKICEGVTVIGDGAFKNCTALRRIVLPDTLVSIGVGAFDGCTSLEEITLPPGIIDLSDRLFRNCKRLRRVVMAGPVCRIGKDVFFNCEGLQEINLPDSIETIGTRAFYRCKGLTGELKLPRSLKTIEEESFLGISITRIRWNDCLKVVGFKAFFRCRYLETLSIPENIQTIDEWAFHGCNRLKEIRFSHVPEMGEWLTNRSTIWYCPRESSIVAYCQDFGYFCHFLETEMDGPNETLWNCV